LQRHFYINIIEIEKAEKPLRISNRENKINKY
jgi:hypothetical protein